MSPGEELKHEMVLLLRRVHDTCKRFGYENNATLLLRHPIGSSKSLLLTTETDVDEAADCLRAIKRSSVHSVEKMNAHDARKKLESKNSDLN